MDELEMIPTGDPLVDRADALIRLVKAIDETGDKALRALLYGFALKVDRSITIPSPKAAELFAIDGGGNA
jgi:hypothetical protein